MSLGESQGELVSNLAARKPAERRLGERQVGPPILRTQSATLSAKSSTTRLNPSRPNSYPHQDGLRGERSSSPTFSLALEDQLLQDARDGRLDQFDLLQAGLIASGVETDRELTQLCSDPQTKLASSKWTSETESTKARRVFEWLTTTIITGSYNASSTELDKTLITGDYNCVTTTILYTWACRQLGLKVSPVATTGHVFCVVGTDPPLEVQTTSRDWFEKRDIRLADAYGQVANELPKEGVRTLSDVQLVAKIYYNRGVSALEQNAFREAIQLLRISYQLDPSDEPTKSNLLAGFNNWALTLADQGAFDRAVAKISEGLMLDDRFEILRENELHVHERWAKEFANSGEYANALRVIGAVLSRRPGANFLVEAQTSYRKAWAVSLLKVGKHAEALKVIREQTRSDRAIDEVQIFGEVAEEWIDQGQSEKAASLLKFMTKHHPNEATLRRLYARAVP